ncbi:MAG: hypothetical protein M1819_003601 [Sarea resinae]|nr:MAG: hypothetical protein M1819_003601 [Sarea resinae]
MGLPTRSTSIVALLILLLLNLATPAVAAKDETVTTMTTIMPSAASATTTTTIPTPNATNEPSYTSSSLFQSTVLNSTNVYRAQHSAANLTWNATLADTASEWAKKCLWSHSGDSPGENLAEGYANTTAAVEAWGNERSAYSWSHPRFSEKTGHFTQLVWKNTTSVGCAAVWCSSSSGGKARRSGGPAQNWYLVCEYWPRGNVQGEYKYSVGKRVKTTSTTSTASSTSASATSTQKSSGSAGRAAVAGGMEWAGLMAAMLVTIMLGLSGGI